jgi:hypothetical protein
MRLFLKYFVIFELFSVLTLSSVTLANTLQCSQLFTSAEQKSSITRAINREVKSKPIKLKDLKSAISKLEKDLTPGPDNIDGLPWTHPYSAFFRKSVDDFVPLTDELVKLNITDKQLQSSWKTPLSLSPLNLTLYKGHLFPAGYYFRRTWTGRGFNRSISSSDFEFGKQMPYAVIDGSNIEIFNSGGSRKMFDIWLQDHVSSDGSVSLYRGTSNNEYEQQLLIQKLLKTNLSEIINYEDIQALQKLSNEVDMTGPYGPWIQGRLAEYLNHPTTKTRNDLLKTLLEIVGHKGIFVSFNYFGAAGFRERGGPVMEYKISKIYLNELINKQQFYLGIEDNYFELLFFYDAEVTSRLVSSLFSVRFR